MFSTYLRGLRQMDGSRRGDYLGKCFHNLIPKFTMA
jgi:hypothetical protein